MKMILTILLVSTIWSSTIRTAVYQALSSGSVEKIDYALTSLDSENDNAAVNAYRGTLLMKKAGLINGPLSKLEMFKEGHQLLETEIDEDPKNTEYRFLRLIIQEHAPKMLGYDRDIDEDKLFIINHFVPLSSEMKVQIREYAARSTILSTSELVD